MSTQTNPPQVDIWGCRGSRSLPPRSSRHGTHTSCYSIALGEEVIVLDAGRGITKLSNSLRVEERFKNVKRLHIFVSHSHLDHWEGLKDADWFWMRGNGLDVRIYGSGEALNAIKTGHEPPKFVPLEVLSMGTVERLEFVEISAGETLEAPGWQVSTFPLHHYSGEGEYRVDLDTLGFQIRLADGPTVAYLCDHEPTAETAELERSMIEGSHLAFIDAHFRSVDDQKYGHGSIENAAKIAGLYPDTILLATHHGAASNDDDIVEGFRSFGKEMSNFELAVEGYSYAWDPTTHKFKPL